MFLIGKFYLYNVVHYRMEIILTERKLQFAAYYQSLGVSYFLYNRLYLCLYSSILIKPYLDKKMNVFRSCKTFLFTNFQYIEIDNIKIIIFYLNE